MVSAGGNTYAYDDNGNMVSGAGRTLTWTSFNKPATVVDAATRTAFVHGPDRARIVQTRVQGATTTVIVYVAGLFERVSKTGEATKFVHYIFAGSQRIAIRTTDNAPTPTDRMRYLHQDHLGSVDTITDAAGAVVERLSYGAFGKRRIAAGANAWTDPALAIAAVNTPRGFTGHEHLDDFQLVHMNGRVYDPALGRFMSADPFVQFAESTQGLNRYAYVDNNPLSFTDPSGYFIGKLFKVFRNFFRKMLSVPIIGAIANIAIGIYCGPAAPVCLAQGSALLAAASGGDIFKAAAIAYVSAEAFRFVGHGLPLPKDPGLRYLAKAAALGVVGGVRSVASGGKFGPGFLAASFTQLASPAIGRIEGDGLPTTGSTGSPGALSMTPRTTPRARPKPGATTPSATSSTSPTWARRTMSTAPATPPGRGMPARTRWSRRAAIPTPMTTTATWSRAPGRRQRGDHRGRRRRHRRHVQGRRHRLCVGGSLPFHRARAAASQERGIALSGQGRRPRRGGRRQVGGERRQVRARLPRRLLHPARLAGDRRDRGEGIRGQCRPGHSRRRGRRNRLQARRRKVRERGGDRRVHVDV